MKKLLGFICVLLIAVFAVMPNTYAEAQKDYGNLDMNRWVVVEEIDNNNILVDKLSIEYFDKDGSKLCNLWMCTFDKDKKSYVLDNITLIYEKRMFSLNDTIYFDSKGKIKKSYNYTNTEFSKIVPSSIGESIYYFVFDLGYVINDKYIVNDKNE